MLGKNGKEGQLGPSVAFAKRVDGIDLSEQMRSLGREVRRCQAREVIGVGQLPKSKVQVGVDVFGIAEPVAPLADANGTNLARPIIDVLEQMVVESKIMGNVQLAFWPRCSSERTTNMAVSNSSSSFWSVRSNLLRSTVVPG